MADSDTYEARYMALMQRFGRHVVAYVARHARSAADADELMQETLAVVYQAVGSLDASSSERQQNRWLRQVMRTAYVRHRRHEPRLATVPLDAVHDREEQPAYDAEMLDDLMARLDADERHLLQRHLEGYTAVELGCQLGLDAGTVRQRLHRIKLKLKTIYNKLYENR